MKIITNPTGIKIEFEEEDNANEIELAHSMIRQLLCLLRITYEMKEGDKL